VAYITATRFTRQKVVTVSVNDIHFKKAITQGSLVEIIGKVRSVGNVKLEIAVEIFVESTCCDLREKAVEALFTFSAINNRNKPVCLEHRNFNNDLPVHMNS
jgi:acyl-CoA hydrolase